MAFQILQGDVREQLQNIEEKSIQTCVTSPPYWGLRDYGAEGQLGLEHTPEEYVANMVEVFREVKRVLRDDGTVWLNLGDSYNGTGGGQKNDNSPKQPSNRGAKTAAFTDGKNITGLKPKDLVGIPWLVAFALRADGWYLRSDIIWHKPNPMPESVTDRPTKSHEYIFLLSKSQKYFYDAEAIKEPADYDGRKDTFMKKSGKYESGEFLVNVNANSVHSRGHERWPSKDEQGNPTRNKRSVWTVSTQPYPGAHFATFPPKLIEPCILAGTSPKACEVCGSPYKRNIDYKPNYGKRQDRGQPEWKGPQVDSSDWKPADVTFKGWQPTCTCTNEGMGKCKVLDPFAGSGTTLWVAETNGRDSVGIELNPEYIELINKRMDNMQMNLFMTGVI